MEEFNCQHTAKQNADVAVRNIIAGDRITTATDSTRNSAPPSL